ncbi:Cof-type HAD-IIB family hydrolase [Fructobacillus sp. M1-13]|uniref:HAD family phosphatase n=1 Tax=Fructobacillus papyriferae TaxID=2713171 RepID=A0ABS5QPV9_9LACO|nr:HAD family hydrolase [Fructobacillus papyriferae]MBS9334862.1 HAD family phosphatase [Fructobacillus papyriferae]MCD2158852.1 Cof-type HAD-IIB family hydrolase [Fructobacillus papyriferae]
MTIQLIATDLDATFLNDQKTFDQNLYQEMVEKAKAKGVTFVVATGNHPDKVRHYFSGVDQSYLLIANNGAEVVTSSGQVLATFAIDPSAFAPVVEQIDNMKERISMGLVFTGTEKAFMLRSQADLGLGFDKAASYFKSLTLIDDLSEIDEPILKMTVNIPEYELPFIKQIEDMALPVHVTTSGYGAIDFVAPNVNKGVALFDLSQRLNIQKEAMAAFGDGLNDLEMLEYVGQPYIMPNADPMLLGRGFKKAVADNNHDGVLKTILQKLL